MFLSLLCIFSSLFVVPQKDTVTTAVPDSLSVSVLSPEPDILVEQTGVLTDTLFISVSQAPEPEVIPATGIAPVVESLQEDVASPPVPPKIGHVLFKGIPVDGSSAEFGKKLEKNGFKLAGGNIYTGTFAGVQGSEILVSASGGCVWKVTVLFPSLQNWVSTKEQYLKFKNWFSWKYVTSPTVVRESLTPRFKEGCGQEVWGFESGASMYFSTYDIPDGSAVVYVIYDRTSTSLRVCIDYIDRMNSILKEEKDMSDI